MGSLLGKISEETPKYVVLSKTNEYEIREYEPRVEVCTVMDTLSGNQGSPFRRLAGYIGVLSKPQNKSANEQSPEAIAMTAPVLMQPSVTVDSKPTDEGEQIAMTAPVLMQNNIDEKETGQALMSFILPSKYTFETAPKPTNPKVFLRKVPKTIEAVITFSGNYRMNTCGNKRDELFAALKRDSVNFQEKGWVLKGYNPPWTISFMRTNEIAVPVVDFTRT